MFKYNCLNPIASVGLDLFSNDYEKVEDLGQADAALVRVLPCMILNFRIACLQ